VLIIVLPAALRWKAVNGLMHRILFFSNFITISSTPWHVAPARPAMPAPIFNSYRPFHTGPVTDIIGKNIEATRPVNGGKIPQQLDIFALS